MNYRILLIAPLAAVVLSVSAADLRMPAGWQNYSTRVMATDGPQPHGISAYEIGIDPASEAGGSASLTVRSVAPLSPSSQPNIGTAHQMLVGYAGKRVRFSGQVRANAARGWAGLYLGVGDIGLINSLLLARPGAEKQLPLGAAVPAADDAWHDVSVVLDVPIDAVSIAFGLVEVGEGQVWARGLSFDVVGPEVAPTQTRIGIDLQAVRRVIAESRAQTAKFPPAPLINAALD